MTQEQRAADGQSQVQAAKRNPANDVNSIMLSQRKQIEMALPKHMSPDRMLRIALTEIRKNPELGLCDPLSFLGAVVQCAQIGLEPGSGLGHAYLIPFNNRKKNIKEVVFITGYRGKIELARRSGQVTMISARIVHEKDKFEFAYGDDERITHVPSADADPGRITWCYAIAKLKDGSVQREVMSRAELDAHKERFSKGNPVWNSDFPEMCRKTLIHRVSKYLPQSPEMAMANEKEEALVVGESQRNWDVLDASYEPKAIEHDPEKIKAELAAGGSAMQTEDDKKKAEVDKRNAVALLDAALAVVAKAKGNPAVILGKNYSEITAGSPDHICAAADRLTDWIAKNAAS